MSLSEAMTFSVSFRLTRPTAPMLGLMAIMLEESLTAMYWVPV